MTAHLTTGELTLPEALMAFLHNDEGQVYQSARPKQLTAAAELGEMLLQGQVGAADDTITVAPEPDAPTRPWMTDAVADLGDTPVKIDTWIRRRRDSLTIQQEAAQEQGVLHHDRAKLAGLVGYERHMVDDALRQSILAELDGPAAQQAPRVAALAKLLTTPALARVQRFDKNRQERLTALASAAHTPVPGPLFTALDYGVATAIGIGILGS